MILLVLKKNFSTGKADLIAPVRPFQPLEPVALSENVNRLPLGAQK